MRNGIAIKGGTPEERLAQAMAIPYIVQVKQRGEFFFLLIPELSLAVSHASLDQAHAQLQERKESLFRLWIDSGEESRLPRPRQPRGWGRELLRELALTAFRMTLAALVVALGVAMGVALVADKVGHLFSATYLSDLMVSTAKEIQGRLDTSDEQVRVQVETVRRIKEKWRPVLEELFPPPPPPTIP